jgi:hypothetical protein
MPKDVGGVGESPQVDNSVRWRRKGKRGETERGGERVGGRIATESAEAKRLG